MTNEAHFARLESYATFRLLLPSTRQIKICKYPLGPASSFAKSLRAGSHELKCFIIIELCAASWAQLSVIVAHDADNFPHPLLCNANDLIQDRWKTEAAVLAQLMAEPIHQAHVLASFWISGFEIFQFALIVTQVPWISPLSRQGLMKRSRRADLISDWRRKWSFVMWFTISAFPRLLPSLCSPEKVVKWNEASEESLPSNRAWSWREMLIFNYVLSMRLFHSTFMYELKMFV